MYLFLQNNLFKKRYFSFLLAALPFSFIAGNMIININTILILLSALIIFNKRLLDLQFFRLDKLLFFYFFIIVVSGLLGDFYFFSNKLYWNGLFATTIKSLFFLKFLLLYLILRYLVEKEILIFKYFFITCAAASIFVCFDIFYQFINGEDIFGFKYYGSGRKLGGPFGDELIAGSFIQRFSLFSFFLIPLFYNQRLKKYLYFITPLLFIIFLIGIILSGNRMPLILFMLSIVLIMIFHKQIRRFFFPAIIIFILVFTFAFFTNKEVKSNFHGFYFEVTKIIISVTNSKELGKDKDEIGVTAPQYYKEFHSFYDTWLMNKYIGGGIKNFRYFCHKRPNIEKNTSFICNMHPHNYYLEILTETGLIGFFVIVSIFLIIFFKTFYKKYFSKKSLQKNVLIVPFMFLFIVEIFPIKSTGSFYTTGNATYWVLLIGILIGIMRKENLIEK